VAAQVTDVDIPSKSSVECNTGAEMNEGVAVPMFLLECFVDVCRVIVIV
jgi:hypothetical protein